MNRDLKGKFIKGHSCGVRDPYTGRFITKEQWIIISNDIDRIISQVD